MPTLTRTVLTVHIRGGLFKAETVHEAVKPTLLAMGWTVRDSRVEDGGAYRVHTISFDVEVPTDGFTDPRMDDHTGLEQVRKTLKSLHERYGINFRSVRLGRR